MRRERDEEREMRRERDEERERERREGDRERDETKQGEGGPTPAKRTKNENDLAARVRVRFLDLGSRQKRLLQRLEDGAELVEGVQRGVAQGDSTGAGGQGSW